MCCMKIKTLFSATLIAVAASFVLDTSYAAAGNISVSGGHFFKYRGETFPLIGDSATQSVMQNLNVDYISWLDELSAVGVNSAMIWAWMAVPQTLDGKTVDSRYGYVVGDITPWARSGSEIANDGKTSWDLNKFDARYWRRLRKLIEYAERKNIVLMITVFDGWPKRFEYHPFNERNGGPIPEPDAPSGFLYYLKSLVSSNKGIDGRRLFWTLYDYSNEVLERQYDEKWPWELKNQYFQERFAAKFIEVTCGYSNVIYELVNEGSKNIKYDRHWIRFFKKRCDKLITINDDYTPLDARRERSVDIISWHSHKGDSLDDLNRRWGDGFKTIPAKPVINSETVPAFYDGFYSAEHIRKIVWSIAVAGGSIFIQDDTVFSFDPDARQVDSGRIMRQYLGIVSKFFRDTIMHLDSMVPFNEMVTSGSAYAMAGADEYIVYFPESNRVSLNLYGERCDVTAEWIDPVTGNSFPAGQYDSCEIHEIITPFDHDSVLYIKKNEDL